MGVGGMVRGGGRRALVCAAASLTAVACADGERACTAAGATSGVGLNVQGVGWKVVEFCIDDECPPTRGTVTDEPASYAYRLRVQRPDGTMLVSDGVIDTMAWRINGEGCAPLTANAWINVDPLGTVTIEHPGN